MSHDADLELPRTGNGSELDGAEVGPKPVVTPLTNDREPSRADQQRSGNRQEDGEQPSPHDRIVAELAIDCGRQDSAKSRRIWRTFLGGRRSNGRDVVSGITRVDGRVGRRCSMQGTSQFQRRRDVERRPLTLFCTVSTSSDVVFCTSAAPWLHLSCTFSYLLDFPRIDPTTYKTRSCNQQIANHNGHWGGRMSFLRFAAANASSRGSASADHELAFVATNDSNP